MQRRSMLSLGIALLASVLFSTANAADATPEVLCPVSGKAASAEHTLPYKGGVLQFCCSNCPAAFKADPAKYAAKANLQLVATHQAEQVNCPFTGKPIDPSKSISLRGVDVAFCCAKCEAKAEQASPSEQLNMIFADKPFEQGFKVTPKK